MYRYNVLIIYWVVINILAFWTYGADKRRAKQNLWRISEKTLLILAFAGGSIGALLGMQIFRHKTKKLVFKIGIPCMLLAHAAAAVWWITS